MGASSHSFVLSLVPLVLLAACSCGSDGSATSDSDGGAGAEPSGGTTTSATVGVGASGAGGSGGTAGSGAVGGNDPGWVTVSWDNPCPNLQVATNPAAVAPPIAWEPCDNGLTGCEKLAGYPEDERVLVEGSVERDDGLWTSFQVGNKLEPLRKSILFDPTGTAVHAFRTTEPGCVLGLMVPTQERLFYGVQPSEAGASVFVELSNAYEVEKVLPFEVTVQGLWSGDHDVLALEMLGGVASVIYDAASGTSTNAALFDGVVADNRVYGKDPDGSNGPDIGGVRWSREYGTQLLVNQSGLTLNCLGSNGTDLFWAARVTADLNGQPGQLWRSPEVGADPADLQPTFVMDLVPELGSCEVVDNQFLYLQGYPGSVVLHVMDLGTYDTKSFPMEGDIFRGFNALTDTHLYYSNGTRPVRQALDP